jgi:NO-binding membrane sensor protein with MHYT domain
VRLRNDGQCVNLWSNRIALIGGLVLAEVRYFSHGWLDLALAVMMAFLGCLLGLVIIGRSRESQGLSRGRWIGLAAVAIGGTGVWLLHFMAMLGFDVPDAPVRYDVGLTAASLGIAIVAVGVGLLSVGFAEPTLGRLGLAGTVTGLGLAAMHYTGVAAMRLPGTIRFSPPLVVVSMVLAVAVATLLLWFAVVVRGGSATLGAAAIMAVAAAIMHYTAMAAISVDLTRVGGPVDGVNPFLLLPPISLLACVVMSALAYATVGYSVRQENAKAEATLARTRFVYGPAAMSRLGVDTARHR